MRLFRLLVVALFVVASSQLHAQQITATYGISHSSNEIIGSPNGYAVHLFNNKGRFAGGVGYRRYRGTHNRVGDMCDAVSTGCSQELIRGETHQAAIEVLGGLTTHAAPRGASLDARTMLGFQVVQLRSQSRGAATGRDSEIRQGLVGVSLGFDFYVRRSDTSPLGVRLGTFWEGNASPVSDGVALHSLGAVSALRAELGLTWYIPGVTP